MTVLDERLWEERAERLPSGSDGSGGPLSWRTVLVLGFGVVTFVALVAVLANIWWSYHPWRGC